MSLRRPLHVIASCHRPAADPRLHERVPPPLAGGGQGEGAFLARRSIDEEYQAALVLRNLREPPNVVALETSEYLLPPTRLAEPGIAEGPSATQCGGCAPKVDAEMIGTWNPHNVRLCPPDVFLS